MRPVVAQAHRRATVSATGCVFNSHSRKEMFKFSFLYDVEFRYSTRNACKIQWIVGNGSRFPVSPLPILLRVGDIT